MISPAARIVYLENSLSFEPRDISSAEVEAVVTLSAPVDDYRIFKKFKSLVLKITPEPPDDIVLSIILAQQVLRNKVMVSIPYSPALKKDVINMNSLDVGVIVEPSDHPSFIQDLIEILIMWVFDKRFKVDVYPIRSAFIEHIAKMVKSDKKEEFNFFSLYSDYLYKGNNAYLSIVQKVKELIPDMESLGDGQILQGIRNSL